MTDAVDKRLTIDTPAPRQPGWWVMLGLLVVVLLPLLTALSKHATTHTMEYVAILSSQETWLRMQGEGGREPVRDAWVIPYLHAQPRVTKPPMTVWLNLLAWSDLTPSRATAQDMIFRARLVSVGLGMLTIFATFWIGSVLRDRWMGLLAAGVLGSAFMFQLQSRTASYDIHFVAFATLAIAFATWAINPTGLKVSTRRAVIGWSLAGVALAMSTLCKGPLACVVTVLPVLLMMGLSRGRWKQAGLGLLLMAGITAALVLPWYFHASAQVPTATQTWSKEFRAARSEFQPPWYYLLLLVLVLPWTLWLIGGLFQPFVRATGAASRRRLIAWGWLVALLVMFSIPGAKQNRYILPLFPAAALVIASLWRDHQAQADAGEVDKGINLLRTPHWLGLLVASVALPTVMLLQDWMRWKQWIDKPVFDGVETPVVLMFGSVLAALALFGWRRHLLWKPHAAALVTVGWMSVCMTFVWMAYPSGASAHVEAGRHMHRAVGNESLGFLVLDREDARAFRECEPFRLYLARIPWPLELAELDANPPALLFARDAEAHAAELIQRGYHPIDHALADRELQLTLWQRGSTSSPVEE